MIEFCHFIIGFICVAPQKSDFAMKNLHCHISDDVDRSNCYWKGTSPMCSSSNNCPSGFTMICKDACGDGKCCVTGMKALCCPTPKVTPAPQTSGKSTAKTNSIQIILLFSGFYCFSQNSVRLLVILARYTQEFLFNEHHKSNSITIFFKYFDL